MPELTLKDRTIAIPETRELSTFVDLLKTAGANVVTCPLVAILDAPDHAPIEKWLTELAAGQFDDVILFTGEGVQRLLDRAQRAGIFDSVVAGLARARTITRGPKPARALTQLKLRPTITATNPTTGGIMEALAAENLSGRRVGVQLYGGEPNETLMSFLRGGGAVVSAVAPYIYAPASDDERVLDLITRMSNGTIDAIAFTSASQVERLFSIAASHHVSALLLAGLARTRVAAVGPIVEKTLMERSVRVDLRPARNYFLKPLVAALAASFTTTPSSSANAA